MAPAFLECARAKPRAQGLHLRVLELLRAKSWLQPILSCRSLTMATKGGRLCRSTFTVVALAFSMEFFFCAVSGSPTEGNGVLRAAHWL